VISRRASARSPLQRRDRLAKNAVVVDVPTLAIELAARCGRGVPLHLADDVRPGEVALVLGVLDGLVELLVGDDIGHRVDAGSVARQHARSRVVSRKGDPAVGAISL